MKRRINSRMSNPIHNTIPRGNRAFYLFEFEFQRRRAYRSDSIQPHCTNTYKHASKRYWTLRRYNKVSIAMF